MKWEIEYRTKFSSVADHTEEIRTIRDEFVIDFKNDIFNRERIGVLSIPWNGYSEIIKRSSEGFLEDGLIEIQLKLHNACGSLLLEPKFIETTDHPLTHFSADF